MGSCFLHVYFEVDLFSLYLSLFIFRVQVAGDGMDARQFLHNMLDGESPGADILKK